MCFLITDIVFNAWHINISVRITSGYPYDYINIDRMLLYLRSIYFTVSST